MASTDDTGTESAVTPGPRSFAVPGNDLTGYIGVAPEYMTYASPNQKPLLTEEEAYLYTNLSDEQIEATRNRTLPDGVELPKNERPAVAEDTAGSTAVISRTPGMDSITLDPQSGYQHPLVSPVVEDEDTASDDDTPSVSSAPQGLSSGRLSSTESGSTDK